MPRPPTFDTLWDASISRQEALRGRWKSEHDNPAILQEIRVWMALESGYRSGLADLARNNLTTPPN